MSGLVIVDTGCANLASVKFAFERADIACAISADPSEITAADRVIIPGVGAAPYAMRSIEAKGLTAILRGLTQPVMGICLGMQLLFETLTEGAVNTAGLGLIPGQVKTLQTGTLPAPHMGWNSLSIKYADPVLDGLSDGEYAYFVHGYAVPVGPHTLAETTYGATFSAIVRRGNVWGCQFHPERSASVGARILKNFASVTL